jgi:hypothetical protein
MQFAAVPLHEPVLHFISPQEAQLYPFRHESAQVLPEGRGVAPGQPPIVRCVEAAR